jgi:hypothetical protein
MTHAWCHDIARDAAVRAAEDNRTGPLPTLGECIDGMFPKSVSASSAVEQENKGDGMRTERVTLEITHSVPVAQWNWEAILETYRPGESVRVVEETHFDDLAQVAMERDAAIRERDNERLLRIETETYRDFARREKDAAIFHITELRTERDKLRARVAELEAASGGGVIRDMTEIVRSNIADADEKHAAMSTLVEAVCPGWVLTQAASGGGDHFADASKMVEQPWQKATLNQAVSIIVDGGDWGRGNDMDHGKLGAAVIWADKEIDRLSRELKEYAKQLAAYELEKRSASMRGVNCFATPAAGVGGVSSSQPISGAGKSAVGETQEPVAWEYDIPTPHGTGRGVSNLDPRKHPEVWHGATGVPATDARPLYRAPPQPRGWLTKNEIAALTGCCVSSGNLNEEGKKTIRNLLARSSPPEVVIPALFSRSNLGDRLLVEQQVKQALAAAGVAVKEVGT